MGPDASTEEQTLGRDLIFRTGCFVVTALVLVAGGTTGQAYDAFVYTDMPLVILEGRAVPEGYDLRGALTWIVYMPAAIGVEVGMPLNVGVLAQNSAVIAAVSAYLLPGLAASVGRSARGAAVAGSLLVVVVLGRFAPVGLMDLWAGLVVLLAVYLVMHPTAGRVLTAP